MIKAIPCYWHKSPNFGDHLTAYLVKQITGLDAVWSNQEYEPKYMITGSLLNDPMIQSCIVWGAGIAYSDTLIKKPLDIKAVRGPISREIIMRFGHDCPEVYGDPCLLLPRFYSGQVGGKKYKLGIIPHMIDYAQTKMKYWDMKEVQVIDLTLGIEHVVNRVQECEQLISSSLHGIIVAHTYEKPCMWVKFSEGVLGDGTKFRDYLRSVGHEIYEPLDMKHDIRTLDNILGKIPQNTTLNIDLEALWKACPLKE